jgi:hypothetical protein
MMKKLTPVILLLSFSLNVSAFDSTSIENFFKDVKKTSIQFYKDNKEDINKLTSNANEIYNSGKQRTSEFISEQEKRYQDYKGQPLDIKLIDGEFYTSEGKVPAGCFFNLAVENNGDDLVHSVYLNRGYLRGCIDANIPHPVTREGDGFNYKIIKKTGGFEYDIQSCLLYADRRYSDCDNFSIRFKNFDYRIDGNTKQVLGVEKVGSL